MEVYTVSLFGHKEFNNALKVGKLLEQTVRKIIESNEYVEFLIGRNGMFDMFAASVIREVCKECDYGNSSLVLVLPHITPDYKENSKRIDRMYDEIEVCEEAERYNNRLSVGVCNRYMIDRSNLVIGCIERREGGAYKMMMYARDKGKPIINVAHFDYDEEPINFSAEQFSETY